MTTYTARYPELSYFFGSYFHYLWPDLLSSEWKAKGSEIRFYGVIEQFKKGESSTLVDLTRKQLAEFLKEDVSESQTRRILSREFHANIYPPGIGFTYNGWLTKVCSLLNRDTSLSPTMSLPITMLLAECYQKLSAQRPSDEWCELVELIVEDNGLGVSAEIPIWFYNLWQATLTDTPIPQTNFPFTDLINRSRTLDIVNFLAELDEVMPYEYDSYGEGMTFKMPSIGISIFVSLEGTHGTCFYSVSVAQQST
ncbi:MAG: contact-dependent growth inhibition system immunity protein [Candidatus Promineifilaceae bacterium]